MNELFDSLEPKASTWYNTSGVYEGDGSIFSETLGKDIEGMFSICWDDLGNLSIQCSPSNIGPPDSMKIAEDFDKFHDLRVVTESGIFSALRCYCGGTNQKWGMEGASLTLKFSTLAGTFTVAGHPVPSIWNVPLTNFLMDLRIGIGSLDRHPLRVHQPPAIPADLPSDRRAMATFVANNKNRVVAFEFKGSIAFIEHLAAYDEAKSDLKENRSSNRVTSVMVGDIPSGAGVEADSVQEWFPIDILLGLSLASGSRTGMGPIELRGHDGQLCARIHLAVASGRYTDGHRTLSDLIHSNAPSSGLGVLLTCLLKASTISMRRVRLLAAAIDLSQNSFETPEHAFAFIVRALDGLANDLKLARSNLRAELPAPIGDQVRQILANASKSIRHLSKGQDSSIEPKAKSSLVRIADRTLSADSTDDKFGLSLGRVLSHYDLNDEAAVASFYANHPRKDGFGWAQALDTYRGGVIHRGFIDYSTEIEMLDVLCCTRHLIDIAIRICLIEIGYLGTYNPFNMAAMQQSPIHWVKTDRDIGLFGYNGMIPKMIKIIDQSSPS